jgi:hypothetical protein
MGMTGSGGNAMIRLTVPQETAISVTLYSTQGRRVAAVITRKLSAGEHAIELESAHLPKGVYWYEVRAGAFTALRKLTLTAR